MQTIKILTLFSIFSLVVFVLGSSHVSVDQEGKFEGVFKGEGYGTCEGTSANVLIDKERVVKSEQDVTKAVSKAVVDQIQQVQQKPYNETELIAAVQSSSQEILQVIATAVASVSSMINSPAEGCWGIAYGEARAEAVANATVTAIAEAFGGVEQNGDSKAKSEVFASSVQQDIQVVVEEVALLLADGSGNGILSDNRTVFANATAEAINCALASAFGGIIDEKAQAAVLATTGCDIPKVSRTIVVPEPQMFNDGCPCIEQASSWAPAGCGQRGDGDYICYVKSGTVCPCAVHSRRYKGFYWRYCGPTLETMQQWLGFSDEKHDILPMPSASGYCNAVDMKGIKDTIIDTPPPIPTPISTPAPSPQFIPTPAAPEFVSRCPVVPCPRYMSDCCQQQTKECRPFAISQRTYKYMGKCRHTQEDVFEPNFGSACKCVF